MSENTKMNFDGVDEPGKPLTSPGTIAVFLIGDVKFEASKDKGTPFLGANFKELDGSGNVLSQFTESFYITPKAMPRIQHLVSRATGSKLAGEVTEEQMVIKLQNKKLALKVGGRVGSNGNGYPRLAFGNFAASVDKLSELQFSPAEKMEVEAALKAIAESRAKNADGEGAGTSAAGATASGGAASDEDY